MCRAKNGLSWTLVCTLLAFTSVNAAAQDTGTSIEQCRTQARARELFDCSHVSVAAIKSISGIQPDDEFFSLQLKFGGNGEGGDHAGFVGWIKNHVFTNTFTLFSADLALSDVEDDEAADGQGQGADTTATDDDDGEHSRSDLTEASISFNRWLGNERDMVRGAFAGGLAKIFNASPYAGIQLGGMERVQSSFFGSYATIAWLWPINHPPADGAHHNVYFEFALRGDDTHEFLNVITFRGGILLPLRDDAEPLTRIIIAVPVGGIFAFR